MFIKPLKKCSDSIMTSVSKAWKWAGKRRGRNQKPNSQSMPLCLVIGTYRVDYIVL